MLSLFTWITLIVIFAITLTLVVVIAVPKPNPTPTPQPVHWIQISQQGLADTNAHPVSVAFAVDGNSLVAPNWYGGTGASHLSLFDVSAAASLTAWPDFDMDIITYPYDARFMTYDGVQYVAALSNYHSN